MRRGKCRRREAVRHAAILNQSRVCVHASISCIVAQVVKSYVFRF